MTFFTKIFRFEILVSNSLYFDPYPNRKIADLTGVDIEQLRLDIEEEINEDFDEYAHIAVSMDPPTITMKIPTDNMYYISWESFALRSKGISVTTKYHIRLFE